MFKVVNLIDKYLIILLHFLSIGATIMLDSNFLTSSAETQIHIIGPLHVREAAKDVIFHRLRNWLKNPDIGRLKTTVSSEEVGEDTSTSTSNMTSTSFDWNVFKTKNADDESSDMVSTNNNNDNDDDDYHLFIPPQFSAQFANQFSPADDYQSLFSMTGSATNNNTNASVSANFTNTTNTTTTSVSSQIRDLLSDSHESTAAVIADPPPGLFNSATSINTSTSSNNMNHLFNSNSTLGSNNNMFKNNNSINMSSNSFANKMSKANVVSNSYNSTQSVTNYTNTASTLNTSDPPASGSSDILDCCVKIIVTPPAATVQNELMMSNIFQTIHDISTCYIQTLPSQNDVTKTLQVAKISIIGDTLTKILIAAELFINFMISSQGRSRCRCRCRCNVIEYLICYHI